MLLTDREIKRLAEEHQMITPFDDRLIRVAENGTRIISTGLSSFGYDLRAAELFQVYRKENIAQGTANMFGPAWYQANMFQDYDINPKAITADDMETLPVLEDEFGRFVRIPPQRFALCHSVETFRLPDYITALVTSKSTYARAGLQVTTTVGEAGWCGQYVIELFNTLHIPLRVYVDEGLAQILFMKGIGNTNVSYQDRHGKYQNQTGITLPKV